MISSISHLGPLFDHIYTYNILYTIYNNGTIYRVVEALFENTHFFLVKTKKKQLVRDFTKISILMIFIKNILFRSGGLYKRGPLMVSYDQF